MQSHLPYNKKLKQFSRDLRNYSTLGEILLWKQVRARSMMGYQFYRQKPIDNFIVDFYCRALKLVIEIDGGYHLNPEVHKSDKEREDVLKQWGLHILRFEEKLVQENMVAVLSSIQGYIIKYESEHPACLQFKQRRTNPPTSNPKEQKSLPPL